MPLHHHKSFISSFSPAGMPFVMKAGSKYFSKSQMPCARQESYIMSAALHSMMTRATYSQQHDFSSIFLGPTPPLAGGQFSAPYVDSSTSTKEAATAVYRCTWRVTQDFAAGLFANIARSLCRRASPLYGLSPYYKLSAYVKMPA